MLHEKTWDKICASWRQHPASLPRSRITEKPPGCHELKWSLQPAAPHKGITRPANMGLAKRQKAVHRELRTCQMLSELIHKICVDVRNLECSLWWVVLAHSAWGGEDPSRQLVSSLAWFCSHLAFIYSFNTFMEHQLHAICGFRCWE